MKVNPSKIWVINKSHNRRIESSARIAVNLKLQIASDKENMMKAKFLLVVSILVLSIALAACGGGGPSKEINVDFIDFLFEPDTFTVPAGETITVTASNRGAVVHELVIFNFGTDAGDKFGNEDEQNIYWEIEVEPGGEKIETFVAPSQPGEYSIVCGIEGHLEAGMVGKLIVVAP